MSFHPDDPRDRRGDWDRWDEGDRRDPWETPVRAPSNAPSVVAPAIVLLVLALVNLVGGLGGLVLGVVFRDMSIEDFQATMTEDDPNALDDIHDLGWTDEGYQKFLVKVFYGAGAASLLAALILALGGFAMLTRKFYGIAMLAAITAFVSPGGCCLFGLVGGIWSIIVLINPDVKKSFT